MLAGGDLDGEELSLLNLVDLIPTDLAGDEYNVITNEALFPPSCHAPAAYPPAVIRRLNRPCTIDDIADWVVDYINAGILVRLWRRHWYTALLTRPGDTGLCLRPVLDSG